MLYKAVLNGTCQGQDIKNILYYRTGVGVDILGLELGGTHEIANEIKNQVWPAFKAVLPVSYLLEDIDVYAFNDESFQIVYQNPFTLSVHQNGDNAQAMDGPMGCAIVRLSLEPTIIFQNGFFPPKRGYLAVGPLTSDAVEDSGEIVRNTTWNPRWDALTAAVSTNIFSIDPPVSFFPIRVAQRKLLGVFKIVSWADVNDATIRNVYSFRRSRQPEL